MIPARAMGLWAHKLMGYRWPPSSWVLIEIWAVCVDQIWAQQADEQLLQLLPKSQWAAEAHILSCCISIDSKQITREGSTCWAPAGRPADRQAGFEVWFLSAKMWILHLWSEKQILSIEDVAHCPKLIQPSSHTPGLHCEPSMMEEGKMPKKNELGNNILVSHERCLCKRVPKHQACDRHVL